MSTITTSIRIDSDLKRDAEDLFSDLGLTFSGAVNAFLKQSVREQRIPFELSRIPISNRHYAVEPLATEQEAVDFANSLSMGFINEAR